MTEKKYTNMDIWIMGAENTANLLNQLTIENQNLRQYKREHLLDQWYCTPTFVRSMTIEYDNIYHRTTNQLEKHLKDNGFLVDYVSRVNVGDMQYYNVEINVSNDKWLFENTNHRYIKKLLGIKNVGLVDFYEHDGMIHEIILVDEDELNEKYLKDGNLVFNNGDVE